MTLSNFLKYSESNNIKLKELCDNCKGDCFTVLTVNLLICNTCRSIHGVSLQKLIADGLVIDTWTKSNNPRFINHES